MASSERFAENRGQPAVDGEPLEPGPQGLDARLDEALRETFPASDPIAVSAADRPIRVVQPA